MSLTWLPNSLLKDVSLPTIIFEESYGQPYSGYYESPTKLIVVVEDEEKSIPNTIAHEFCHHLQWLRGEKMDSKWKVIGTYEESIHHYFHNYKIEMEALLFSNKYAKNETTDWWQRKLVMVN